MSRNKGFSVFRVVVAIVIITGIAVYFYNTSDSSSEKTQASEQKDAQALIAELEKIVVLPIGEEPTIATITDPEKLKDQPFFANAKAGYKVLVYQVAKKAFLYDPVAKKLIEVAPLIINDPAISTPEIIPTKATTTSKTK